MLPTSDPRYSRHQQPETILVVDDEAAVLDVACRALRRAGYHTLAASNADEADALFDAHARSVSMLLTDYLMPGRSGLELFDGLLAKRSGLKVLFMSGSSWRLEEAADAVVAGRPVIDKPFRLKQLTRRVAEVLRD